MNRRIGYIMTVLFAVGLEPVAGQYVIRVETGNILEASKPAGGKTTVKRTTKYPTNIPTSSQRFRPGLTETNSTGEIACLYYRGGVKLIFSSNMGEARILLTTPVGTRIYRTAAKGDVAIEVGDRVGEYHIEVKTTTGSECTFDFILDK